MRATTVKSITALSVLDHDAFEDVGDVLAAVGRLFEEVERFLPLHDHDRIALVVEQPADRLLMDAVGFVLEPVDLDGVAEDALAAAPERRAPGGLLLGSTR